MRQETAFERLMREAYNQKRGLVRSECAECGYPIDIGKDATGPRFCCEACQVDYRESNR